MNKRILKLFNEAGFHQPEMERLGIEDKFEKFAELIVRECANEIMKWKNEPFPFDESTAVWIIKKHFGIEQ